MKISILTNSPNCKAVKQIQNSIIRRGHKAVILILDNIKIVISNNERGFDSIYYTSNNKTSKLSKASIGDAILPRIGSNVPFGAKVIEHIRNMGVYSTISGSGLLIAYDKLKTLQVVSNFGIRTPKTIMGNNVQDVDYIVKQLGLPVIIKFIHGSLGNGISIVESRIGLQTTLQSFSKLHKPFIIQEYIEADSKDIRVLVIGNQVIAAYQRKGRKGDFRANLSQGGSGKPISLSDADKVLCVKAAKAIGLESAGVDLLKDQYDKSYLIEINANYGLIGQHITKINFCDAMVRFLEQKIGTLGNRKTDLNESRKYVEQLLPQVIGKRIHFIDRSNRKRSLTVRSVQDLESVMYDTFRLNIRN